MFSPKPVKPEVLCLVDSGSLGRKRRGEERGDSWYSNSRCAFSILWNCSSEKQKALRCYGDRISGTDVPSGRQQLPGCGDAQGLVLVQPPHCWACSEAEGSAWMTGRAFSRWPRKLESNGPKDLRILHLKRYVKVRLRWILRQAKAVHTLERQCTKEAGSLFRYENIFRGLNYHVCRDNTRNSGETKKDLSA